MKKSKKSLNIKFRPSRWRDIYGQDKIVFHLKRNLKERGIKSFILTGPPGVGKTTFVRIAAKKLGAIGRDFKEFNLGHTGGKDKAREVTETIAFAPFQSEAKVYFFDECHRASAEFWDVLLVDTEEPPDDCFFFFCTTNLSKIPATIQSRSITFHLDPLNQQTLEKILTRICEREEIEIKRGVVREIALFAGGDCRVAINMLESMRSVKKVDLDKFMPITERSVFIEFCQALLRGSSWAKITKLLKSLHEENLDIEKMRRAVLTYMSKILMNGEDNIKTLRAAAVLENFEDPFFNNGKSGFDLACYRCLALAKGK